MMDPDVCERWRANVDELLSRLVALAKITVASGQEPREFIASVNSHIDALRIWEAHRVEIARAEALQASARPERSDCDSDATFQSALRFWEEAQALTVGPNPAPSAPIAVARAVALHTAADGTRTYTYIEDEFEMNAFRDPVIRSSRGEL